MKHIKNQSGNALTGALGMAVMVAIAIFLISLVVSPYQTIDENKNAQLQTMVNAVKGTPFEPVFKARINYDLSDGKIDNKEFYDLEDLYSGYKSSQLTGQDQNFSKKTNADLKTQYQADEAQAEMMKIFFIIVGFIISIIAVLVGWNKARGNL